MDETASHRDASEDILARFVQELADTSDVRGAVAKYQAEYPAMAQEFEAMTEMMNKVEGSSPDGDADLPPYLGGFRLIRRIAQGGMGEVFEAVEERLQRRVAVKIVHRRHLSPTHRARFLREQLVLARLHQTHIVPIFAAGEAGPLQYFAMPYIEGAALHHALRIARQPHTNWPGGETPNLSTLVEMYTASTEASSLTNLPQVGHALELAKEVAPPIRPRVSQGYCRSVAEAVANVAEALHHAHCQGIVHRDVKPSNIMIAPDGKCWIIDFGLAGYRAQRSVDGKSTSPADIPAEPDFVTGILGTPKYMAPEQWTDPEQVDARADIWGLGATLYELLTLQPAFNGANDAEIRSLILATPPVPPKQRVRGLQAGLEAICLKALQRQPQRRYATAQELAADLRCWLRDDPPSVVSARRWRLLGAWARRNKGWAAALGVLLLAVIGALVGWGLLESAQGEAAQREADEAKRTVQMLELQQLRLSEHRIGWSREVLDRARFAAKIRIDENLRSQAAAAFLGFDARVDKQLFHGASQIAWDSEGKRLLMGATRGGTTTSWDRDRDEEHALGHSGTGPVAFLADGKPVQLVAAAQDPSTVVLWDLATGQSLRQFQVPHGDQKQAQTDPSKSSAILAMTGDGTIVAAATVEVNQLGSVVRGRIGAWESSTGKLLVQGALKSTALALSPDGTVLAAADADGSIHFWLLPSGKKLEPLRSGRTSIDCLAFGRNPHRLESGVDSDSAMQWLLATGGQGGHLNIWDLRSRQVMSVCRGSHWDVYAAAFSPDGMTLASAGRSESRLWDVASGQLLLCGMGLDWATDLAFSPNGQQLAVSSVNSKPSDSDVKIYDLEPGRGMQSLRGLVGQIAHVRFSLDGRLIAALSHNWQVAIWNTEENRLLHVLDVPIGFTADNAGLCFSPNGRRFALSTWNQVKSWDVESGRETGSWTLPPGLVEMLAFRTNDELVLFRMETVDNVPPLSGNPWREHRRVCRLRHLSGSDQARTVAEIHDFSAGVFTADISRDGSRIVAAGQGGPDGQIRLVRVYDGASGDQVRTLPLQKTDSGPYLCLDPTGKRLAYTPEDGSRAAIVDLPSGIVRTYLPRCPHSLGPGAYYWAITQASDETAGIILVRMQDGKRLVNVGIEGEMAAWSTFSFDGTRWAWGRTDGGVTVCDIPGVQRRLADMGLGW